VKESRDERHEALTKSFDIVGDIAIIGVQRSSESSQILLSAEDIVRRHRRVKVVLRQVGAVSGKFRLRRLEWVLGEKRTETVHKESSYVFKVDRGSAIFRRVWASRECGLAG
jgi:tRNA (guanine37-N1)-methyltransferase